MGPVTTASPRAVNMGQALKSASDALRWKPKAWARVTVVGSAMAPADRVLPSMPSEPALSTVSRSPGYFSSSRAQAMTNCWLRPPAPGVRSMVTVTSPTEMRQRRGMDGAQGVEALEQVAGGVGVVPVVATVVDHDVDSRPSAARARAFSTRSWLESRISKTESRKAASSPHMEAAAVTRRAGSGSGLAKLGKEGRTPALVAGRLGQVFALEEGADGGRELGSEIVLCQQFADFGDGGVVGRSGTGGERVERAQRHVGQQQADLGGFGRGHGQAAALDGGEVLAQGVDLVDGRAGGEQQLMKGDGVVERDLRVEGQVEHGRAAAGDEEEDRACLFWPC